MSASVINPMMSLCFDAEMNDFIKHVYFLFGYMPVEVNYSFHNGC